MNLSLPKLSPSQRDTLEKYLPVILIAVIVWLAGRNLKKSFWAAFGLYCAVHSGHLMQVFG